MFRFLIFVFTLFCLFSEAGAERPRIGLALSGGGARGAAHIGVLKELERQRVPVDYIAGTSMGAIVGGMYASGLSTDAMEAVLADTDWDDIFKDKPPRRSASMRRKLDDRLFQINKELGVKNGKLQLPSGFIQGQKLQLLLEKLFLPVADIQDFDRLTIPFRAVATDLATSEAVVLGRGSLATSVRASMSVPSVFATVRYDDRILVDGGISNNLPVDVVRDMGADIVIAVDIGTPLLGKGELDGVIEVALQLTNILVRRTTDAQIATLGENDILITPDLGKFSSGDFANAGSIIPNGVNAALALTDRLQPLAVPQPQYEQHTAGRDQPDSRPPVISFIRVQNDSPLSDEYIRSKLSQKLGEPLDFDQLEQDISIIYGLQIFQIIDYRVVQESGQSGLIVDVRQKPWGPKYLQFGLSYASDTSDNNNLSFNFGYTVTPLNTWNGEWRSIAELGEEPGLVTEIHQPLGVGSPYYVNGSLAYTNERFNIYQEGVKLDQVRVKKFSATGALGRDFGHWGDLRLGLSRYVSENTAQFSAPGGVERDVDGGEFFARFMVDTFNHAYFPTEGVRGFAQWLGSREDLGADNDFNQALFDAVGAVSWRRNTLLLGARYFATLDGAAPISNAFRIGGLFDLPGFVDNELSGENLYLLRSAYQRRLANLFNTSPYLGVSLQYGQVFARQEDVDLSDGIAAGAAWLGWDSLLGPLFIGYGRAETGQSSFYLSIGNLF